MTPAPVPSSGPLLGLRVVEFAGIGPGPFAGMLLADMGADVVRIDRADGGNPERIGDLLGRGRRSIGLDLKRPEGLALARTLADRADALIEGFRPGVMERLGLSPEACLERNPRLVYGRVTGWGQDGPLAQSAGHDVNYIALAGALEPIGRAGEPPTPPLNLLGDFGGGGMLLAFGLLSALYERERSGKGQVVDAAMVDGAALLTTLIHGMRQMGSWRDERGSNLVDTGAPFYEVYETADGRYISVGAIEPRFYALLLDELGLDARELPDQMDRSNWPAMKEHFAEIFASKTRDEWCELLEGGDTCFAPVLTMGEAPDHPHVAARHTFVKLDGAVQPAPAPRFSRTPPRIRSGPPRPGEGGASALREWDLPDEEIARLRHSGALVVEDT